MHGYVRERVCACREYTGMCVRECVRVHVCVSRVYVYACECVCTCMCMSPCVRVYALVSVYLCVCVAGMFMQECRNERDAPQALLVKWMQIEVCRFAQASGYSSESGHSRSTGITATLMEKSY